MKRHCRPVTALLDYRASILNDNSGRFAPRDNEPMTPDRSHSVGPICGASDAENRDGLRRPNPRGGSGAAAARRLTTGGTAR